MSDKSHGLGGDDSAAMMQGYYDWQVTTLMLAYDLNDPVSAASQDAGEERRQAVEQEVRTLTLSLVPDVYQADPELDWPADLMMSITRATLMRAAEIAGVRGQ